MKGRSALPRTAFVIGLVVVAGGLAGAAWGRRLLAGIDYFRVRRVEVVGARWVAPDSVVRLAAIGRDRSVWDDYSDVERRLVSHPLIEEAQVHRSGLRALRIAIREVEPVALVGVPELRPVRADGTLLPIDPTDAPVDLPLLAVPARLAPDSTRLADGPALEALRAFARLRALDPGLTAVASDFERLEDGSLMVNLVTSQPARRLALPPSLDEAVVRRVRATLVDLRSRGVRAELVEARYANQIVVRRERS
jgi:cell division septal protein FtsQ